MLPLLITSALLCIPIVAIFISWRQIVWMPGEQYQGPFHSLNAGQRELYGALERDLTVLADEIGERNVSHQYDALVQSAEFIERSLRDAGHETRRQELLVQGKPVWNIEVECVGRRFAQEVVVVGAHYDTVPGSPGANDNGSAVVANLALARMFAHLPIERTIRFVFFVNEESPYYMTDAMGALQYARQCESDGDNIIGMISLETIGCYSDEPLTQRYPVALLRHVYPTTGNFVAFVSNLRSRRFLHRTIRGFRHTEFPSQGIAAPRWLKDIFRSDHAAFWACGYPGMMVTDTANFRYRYYHTPDDTVDKINFDGLARVVGGMRGSLLELAGVE